MIDIRLTMPGEARRKAWPERLAQMIGEAVLVSPVGFFFGFVVAKWLGWL